MGCDHLQSPEETNTAAALKGKVCMIPCADQGAEIIWEKAGNFWAFSDGLPIQNWSWRTAHRVKTLREPERREQRGYFFSSSLRHVHIQESVWTSTSRILPCKRIYLIPEHALGKGLCEVSISPCAVPLSHFPLDFHAVQPLPCPAVWIFTLRSELSCSSSFVCFYFSCTQGWNIPLFWRGIEEPGLCTCDGPVCPCVWHYPCCSEVVLAIDSTE